MITIDSVDIVDPYLIAALNISIGPSTFIEQITMLPAESKGFFVRHLL